MTANAGYHAYATGDVLTAAQVQYNLQNQTVMYFATTTARDAALTGAILVEGMVSYTPATGVMYYNGTAWTAIGSSSPLTTKGDLYTYSTTNARLPIGTNNQVLTADSAQALGLKWATPSGGYTLISTTSLTSGTSTTIGSIPQTYTNLLVMIDGINFLTTAVLRFKLYNNNNSKGSGVIAATAFGSTGYVDPLGATSSTGGFFGSFTVTNYTQNAFGYTGGAMIGSTGSVFGGGDSGAGAGGFTSIVVTSVAGTAVFSSGTVRIYGI